MSVDDNKITINKEDVTNDFSNLTNTGYYHIQIHFKRPVKRAPGSIDFDKDKEYLKRNILKPILCCGEVTCERRKIHPSNISRISICRTKRKRDDIFNNQVVVAPRSQKFDYLNEYVMDKKEEGDIIEIDRRRCPATKEWIKIYYLLLTVPVVAAIASGCISMILLEKADWKDIITISVTVGAGFLALQSVLRRSL
jgi:hypothetical protein